jgi:S-DNA-T family DNA segregation ATPase FtsK/SpoIIIE
VVVDEFATLAAELGGFVPGLLGIAQRGRSLGLHLVLATQRPAGVVSADIRANVGARIALRVASAAESIDVVDAPDAASIDRGTPGRAFLRLGAELLPVQCARVGGAAEPSGVSVVALDRWRRLPAVDRGTAVAGADSWLAAIMGAAAGLPPPHRPWLEPLPGVVPGDELPVADGVVAIGRVDLPAQQRQDVVPLDLHAGSCVLVAGSPGSGRTTALLAAALGAAARYSPAQIEMHAIDGTGTGLRALAVLPHVGTVAGTTPDFGCTAELVTRLGAVLARRRDAGSAATSDGALLVLIDGWEEISAGSEQHDGGRTIDRLLALLPAARAARATIVLAGGRAALAPRVAAGADTRYVLRLNDVADYVQAGLGPRSRLAAPVPGRAIRVADGAEVQFASYGTGPALDARVAEFAARWPDPGPARLRLRPLPTVVRVGELPRNDGYWLGLAGHDAAPAAVDLARGGARLLVSGPPRSGRSTLLSALLAQHRSGQRTVQLVVAAPPRSPLATMARRAGYPVVEPRTESVELPAAALLLVDDAEAFTDTAAGDALAAWLSEPAERTGCRCSVTAARADTLAVAMRGLLAEIKQARGGVLLQPGPLDGELFGLSVPRGRGTAPPGRGVLVPDPAWALGSAALPLQAVMP